MKFDFLNFGGLLNNGVDDFSKPVNEISACKNVYEKDVGSLTKVPGYTSIGGTGFATIEVDKLHYYYRPSTGVHLMIGGGDSGTGYVLKRRTTGDWSALTTIASRAGTNLSIANYLDRAFIVGYRSSDNSFDTNATVVGTTYSTTDTNLTSMPQGRFARVYDGLLYVAHAKIGSEIFPSRVYWNEDPVAGVITWDTSVDFRELGNNDGDMITGMGETAGKLIILKNASLWTWDEYESRKIADIGCTAEKSITEVHGVIYWINKDGVWRFSGGTPQLISRKVQKFIDAMSNSAVINSIGTKYENEYRVYVGDITVDGYLYVKAWLCFDILKETWYIRCTSHSCHSAIVYIDGAEERTHFGTVGGVEKFAVRNDNIFSDDGQEIDSFFTTNEYHFDAPSVVKQNPTMIVYSKNPQGMRLVCGSDSSGTIIKDWNAVLRRNVEELELMVTGNYFNFKFSEKSLSKPWTIRGFTLDIKELEELRK